MIAIGERINGQFNDVKAAIADKDAGPVADLARRQTEAGASYLDINVGTAAEDQQDAMKWLVDTAQAACETPLCLDSQKPDVIRAGLAVCDTSRGVLLNSSPLSKKSDPEVLDTYAGMAQEAGGKLICLTMDAEGVPQNVERRVEIAAEIHARPPVHRPDHPAGQRARRPGAARQHPGGDRPDRDPLRPRPTHHDGPLEPEPGLRRP